MNRVEKVHLGNRSAQEIFLGARRRLRRGTRRAHASDSNFESSNQGSNLHIRVKTMTDID